MAISDYLRKLVDMKNQLVANLKSMGVTADESEKLNTLVPKVLEIETGFKYGVEYVEPYPYNAINMSQDQGVKSIKIPNSVTSLTDNAFYNCRNLVSVTIGNSVTRIGNEAFCYCISLAHIYYKGTQTQWDAITKGTNWNYDMGKNVSGGTVIHYNYTG